MKNKQTNVGSFATAMITIIALALAATVCEKKNQDAEIAALQAQLEAAQAALETAKDGNASAEEIAKLESAVAQTAVAVTAEQEQRAERRRGEGGRRNRDETAAPATSTATAPAATAPAAPATSTSTAAAPATSTSTAAAPESTAPEATTLTGPVVIPATQTVIGYGEFGSTKITSITIHDRVTRIDDNAFSNCTGITSITIPASVTTLAARAFLNWTAEQTIYVPFAQDQEPLGWSPDWKSVVLNQARIVYQGGVVETAEDRTVRANLQYYARGDGFAIRAGSVTSGSVVIPAIHAGKPVTSIDRNTFRNLTGITSITIPASVTSIGDGAFDGCTGLKSVTIGAGVTYIGGAAFRGCTGVTRIVIPASVTTVGSGAFSGWTASQTINVSSEAISGGGWDQRWQGGCNAEIEYTGLGS